MLLIAVKFSARIVVIHLTALLEYLYDCSIRVLNLEKKERPGLGCFHPNTKSKIGHGHEEGLSKHGYIVFRTKKLINFAVHE